MHEILKYQTNCLHPTTIFQATGVNSSSFSSLISYGMWWIKPFLMVDNNKKSSNQ